MKDGSFSLHSIISGIQNQGLISFKEEMIERKLESFYCVNQENPKYIQPYFTDIISDAKVKSQIMLISAAGATGKTELTNYLSAKLQMPIFDLSKHEPVASNSLSGLFTNCLGYGNAGIFVSQLNNGKSVLIIDALDEAYVQTTAKGFDSFLDDICHIASKSTSTSFILLGRTKVMEHCMFYFDKKNITTSLSLIEPFTVDQAKDFINRHTKDSNKKYELPYKAIRDYIVDSVQAFFKTQGDIKNNKIYNQFIGYAPVLLSISKLLDENPNYVELKETLSQNNKKNVDLIVSIVEQVLLREKKEKIGKLVLPHLLTDRSPEFCGQVIEDAYSIDEQCVRILYHQFGSVADMKITDDTQFNLEYEEKIREWLQEHPFLDDKGEIQNAVFESYIIARLMNSAQYKDIVYKYLVTKYKDAFMLFFIFDKLSKERQIDAVYLPFLYGSLKSLDSQHMTSAIDIHEELAGSEVLCDVEFSMDNIEESFEFKMLVAPYEYVFLGSFISDITVDASINILLNKNRTELTAPITLICKNIKVNSGEIIIEKGLNKPQEIIIECNKFDVDYSNGHSLILTNHLDKDACVQIIAEARPNYPFGDYYVGNECYPSFDELLHDEDLKDKYKKLRKIIVLFKSHSKGQLAKCKAKIENQRVAGIGTGKKVLDRLVKTGVLYTEAHLYVIDPEKINSELGVSYQDIRAGIINNQKTIDFLRNI